MRGPEAVGQPEVSRGKEQMPQKQKTAKDLMLLVIIEDECLKPFKLLAVQPHLQPLSMPEVDLNGTSLRDPSRLFYQLDFNRRLIIASYWAVILSALPLWWYTTSIERLSLPTARVHSQIGKELRFPIEIRLDAAITRLDASLLPQLQHLADEVVLHAPNRWKGLEVRLSSETDSGTRLYLPMKLSHTFQLATSPHIPLCLAMRFLCATDT